MFFFIYTAPSRFHEFYLRDAPRQIHDFTARCSLTRRENAVVSVHSCEKLAHLCHRCIVSARRGDGRERGRETERVGRQIPDPAGGS